ncbi:efflux RND transporter permease subunit [Alkalilimnicola ehrlichii]|uniref:efflux RND transporter permease subunit n=1 Tax=Alkalilimnicola ehrlichii TaxID=351052 RepID=UPI002161F24B|nr:efflux RND transporter permease subunit [Alkalilimnicola ehrlichii]
MLKHPGKFLLGMLGFIVATYFAYGALGKGVEFFPTIEPEAAQIQIHARGDLSAWEEDAIVRQVEERLLGMPEFETLYVRTGTTNIMFQDMAEDVIGVIQVEFIDWQQRRPAAQILAEVRERTADIPGIVIEAREQQQGPPSGKPIDIEVTSRDPSRLAPAIERIREVMADVGGFTDVEDSRPLPGIEWGLQVDRQAAARYGADVALLGNAVQLMTGGILISEYRPDDADDEVEIRVRFPADSRSLEQLANLRVPTERGQVPIGNFVRFEPQPQTGVIERSGGQRVLNILADVEEGLLPDNQVQRLQAALAEVDLPGVEYRFRGELEDQEEAGRFLSIAFLIAIGLMTLLLVTQFNSIYQALLVLSAIVLSTAGVLLGLLVSAQPFGVVMSGMGIIALAGIVVNNNIILIDTYNELRGRGLRAREAILRTGAQRLRPVLLTAFTTVLGLLPMVIGMNIDLIGREVSFGAPSTQWWTQLSSTIAGGLSFATVLTLLLTPCLLMIGVNSGRRLRRRRRQLSVAWGRRFQRQETD